MRSTALRRLPLVLVAVAACGGGGARTPGPVVVPSANGSARANVGVATSPPPSGLPPMAAMPPPGVTGSRKAKKKNDAAMGACTGSRGAGNDPAAEVKRLGEACAAATKMHPVGAPIRGTQADRDAHQEQKVRVEANKCYRVYFATDDGVRDAVVEMRDSAGDLVGESPGAALPEDGALCFSTGDEVTVVIAVGSGKGTYAAQLWSD